LNAALVAAKDFFASSKWPDLVQVQARKSVDPATQKLVFFDLLFRVDVRLGLPTFFINEITATDGSFPNRYLNSDLVQDSTEADGKHIIWKCSKLAPPPAPTTTAPARSVILFSQDAVGRLRQILLFSSLETDVLKVSETVWQDTY
jgi:hypothetical protein